MLPAANRMRRSTDFSTVVRAGRRVREGRLVLHFLSDDRVVESRAPHAALGVPAPLDVARVRPLVGLIVGKGVGGSVVRHRVSRRLRAQLATRLASLPVGARTVVRGLPAAATASSAELGADLDRALTRAMRPLSRTGPDR